MEETLSAPYILNDAHQKTKANVFGIVTGVLHGEIFALFLAKI